jgi:hypothetical protein
MDALHSVEDPLRIGWGIGASELCQVAGVTTGAVRR